MSALSPSIAIEFCKLCDWSYQVWVNHRELFDDNSRRVEIQKSMAADTFLRLNTISHEYALLQIAKLHDSPIVAGEITLGIEYILKYGGWDQTTFDKLKSIAKRLDVLAKDLRTVRNKLLSHNDLSAILNQAPLGQFSEGADISYFAALQEFVDIVHSSVVGEPFPFDDLVKNDVVAFMSTMKP